jgi:DNA-binding NarL/FixJ family response regulator
LRILLADDHALVRRGLRTLIDTDPTMTIVAEASDGLEAVRLCAEMHPDVAIFDVAMPKLNGIDASAQAVKNQSDLKVILLSMHSDESYIVRGLAAGVRGYLLKEATDDDLLTAIRTVASGRPFFNPSVSQVLLEDYMRTLQDRALQNSYHLLTDREKEVLQLLAEGRSNKEVAGTLSIGLSTVETHRSHLMQKLGLHNTAEIVLYAVRKGVVT